MSSHRLLRQQMRALYVSVKLTDSDLLRLIIWLVTYCDNGFSDGNWALVRRVASGSNWHIATFVSGFHTINLTNLSLLTTFISFGLFCHFYSGFAAKFFFYIASLDEIRISTNPLIFQDNIMFVPWVLIKLTILFFEIFLINHPLQRWPGWYIRVWHLHIRPSVIQLIFRCLFKLDQWALSRVLVHQWR